MLQFRNNWTGEIHELPDNTPEEIRDAWIALSETIKACERAKDKLKPKIMEMLDDRGQYGFKDYAFRQTVIQRKTYSKSVMREVLDADTFDLLLIPDKTKIDIYLKENVEELGEASTKLRESMVDVGLPYTTLKLEKLK